MTVLKFIGGALAAVILIKLAFIVLGLLAGVAKLLMGLLFLAAAVTIVVFIINLVYRVVTGNNNRCA